MKIYNRFKDKKFTILGIALDKADGREKWINAVEKDQMDWYHVSELNGLDNKAAKLYGIRRVPQNVLIDPQGRIIGRNLEVRQLEKTLATLL